MSKVNLLQPCPMLRDWGSYQCALLLTLGLWHCNTRAVCDQQIHHCAASDIDRVCCDHVAKRDRTAGSHTRGHWAETDRAAGGHAGGDGARCSLVGVVCAHVPLELGWCLAVDPTQVTDEYSTRGRATETTGAVLPLLAMVLLGMDTKVCQRGEAAVAQVADVVLGLVVHPHVICDVSS